MQDAEAADFSVQEFGVAAGQGRIGHHQAERGAHHEHKAARSLRLGKTLKGRAGVAE